MKKIVLLTACLLTLLSAVAGTHESDTLSGGKYIVLEAGTPVSLMLHHEINSARLREGHVVELDVKISIVVNGTEVVRARDYAEGRVQQVRKAGMFGRPGALEIEAVSVRAIDGQIIPLHGNPHSAKGNSRTGIAIGASVGTTTAGLVMLDKKAKGAAFGFSLTGLFVKGQEAIIDKDVILRAYVARRTTVSVF